MISTLFNKPGRALLTFLMVSLVSLFAVGCGDSNEDYVFTGTNPNVQNGNVTFQFEQGVQAQAAVVPVGTDYLTFDFFATNPPQSGQLVFEAEADYANTVTVTGVPTTARSVVITAFDVNGFPIATLTSPVNVVAGATTNTNLNGVPVVSVDFATLAVAPNPVALTLGTATGGSRQLEFTLNFDNFISYTIAGDDLPETVLASYEIENTAVATVNGTGTVTAVAAGSTNGTATLTFNGSTVEAPFNVTVSGGVLTPVTVLGPVDGAITLPQGGFEYALVARVGFTNATNDVFLNTTSGYEVEVEGAAVEFNETSGTLVTADSVAAGNATSTVTVFNSNNAEVESFNVTVTTALITGVVINDDSVEFTNVDDSLAYTVTATYAGGGTADVTYSPNVAFEIDGGVDVADFNLGLVTSTATGLGDYVVGVDEAFRAVNFSFEFLTVFVGQPG